MTIGRAARDAVRRRAGRACEYCRLPEHASLVPHQVDHIVAVQHGGSDALANLGLSCIRCNLNKGPNIASVDSETHRVVRLYRPRSERWSRHFALDANGRIHGRTAVGRATAALLDMNDRDRVTLRRLLMRGGWRP